MKRIFAVFAMFAALALVAPAQSTHSSATLTQVVTAAPAIAATVSITSSLNPSLLGQLITYTISVTGTNNGAHPAGTVQVQGITGSQTVTLVNGTATCSETPTTPTPVTGSQVTAIFISSDNNFK